jgi:hypothetical protein
MQLNIHDRIACRRQVVWQAEELDIRLVRHPRAFHLAPENVNFPR